MNHRYTLIAYRRSTHGYDAVQSDLQILSYEHDEFDQLMRTILSYERRNQQKDWPEVDYELTILLDGLDIEDTDTFCDGEDCDTRREILATYKAALHDGMSLLKAEREIEIERQKAKEAERQRVKAAAQRERDLQTLAHLKAKYEGS